MPEYLTQQEAFQKCKINGAFIILDEIDKEKIQSTVIIAQGDIDAADRLKKDLPKKTIMWNSVYKLYYGALHELTEAFLRIEKITKTTLISDLKVGVFIVWFLELKTAH